MTMKKLSYICLCSLRLVMIIAAIVSINLIRPAVPTAYANDLALSDDMHVEGLYEALREKWIGSMMMMTEQLVVFAMKQMVVVGALLDAHQNVQVLQAFQELSAEAHKDFRPSMQMCVFGTNVRSLAAAETIYKENALAIDSMMQERDLLRQHSVSDGGVAMDYEFRIDQFKRFYCDPREFNNQWTGICAPTSGAERRMRDVDFISTVYMPYTLNVNFVDENHTPEQEDLIALGRNLYASQPFDFVPETALGRVTAQSLFMEARSVHAIRSVARRSFAHITGMKAAGQQDGQIYQSAPYMKAIVRSLGIDDSEINDFIGTNPSYFAQMEVLTNKMFQSPAFFTNLYENPQNVRRTGVALQALKLMQDRDRFEAALRREMLISMLVEVKLREYQSTVNSFLLNTISGN